MIPTQCKWCSHVARLTQKPRTTLIAFSAVYSFNTEIPVMMYSSGRQKRMLKRLSDAGPRDA